MKKFFKGIIKALLKILYIFPIKKKKVFLMSFNVGYDAKAFYNFLNSKGENYRFIWGYTSKKRFNKIELENVKYVKIGSIIGIFHLMTSQILLYNINLPTYIPYRRKQIKINTWHGNGYKKCGKYANMKDFESFKLNDCFISHSKKFTEWVLIDSMEYNGDILNCGAPRNDIFFSESKNCVIRKIRNMYGIKNNEKIVLYAPTFRGNYSEYNYNIDVKMILESLKKKFNNDFKLFYRLHPNISMSSQSNSNEVVDVTRHPDMQELLCASDILITDYSGSVGDFALMKKPIFIYAPDINDYDRGFYLEPKKWPYSIALNNEELQKNIFLFDYNDYKNKLEQYDLFIENYENGKSCETIYKYVKEKGEI